MNVCTDCHTPIPHGHAVIRSRSFERVTFCQPCAKTAGIAPAQPWAPTVEAVVRPSLRVA